MERSEAQKKYLQRRYAENARANKANCCCAGCELCKGFVAGCECDKMSVEEALRIGRDRSNVSPN